MLQLLFAPAQVIAQLRMLEIIVKLWRADLQYGRSDLMTIKAMTQYFVIEFGVGQQSFFVVGGQPMLSKQQCPHTGIVNFFTRTDPLLSVGSIAKHGERNGVYHWRWYDAARTISGIATDMRSAEERLHHAYRQAVETSTKRAPAALA